jgi:uncharacterized protein (DUF983 family)
VTTPKPTPKPTRTPSPTRMVLRGLVRHCPNCGSGRVFRRWFTMRQQCPRCGITFEREEGFFLGAYVINFGLVLTLLGAWILIGVIATQPDPPLTALVIGGMVMCAAVALAFYPSSKTVWAAIDLIMTPVDREPAR